MKVLLDECLPVQLRHHLTGHEPVTVTYMGWCGIKNRRLLGLAVSSGFGAFLTTDTNLQYQQNLSAFPIAVLTVEAPANTLEVLLPLVPKILDALNRARPGDVIRISP